MAVVGDAYVEFHGDVSGLDSDIEKAVKRIKNREIPLEGDLDMSKAFKKIRDLRYRTKSNPVSIPIVADDKAFSKSISRLSQRLKPVMVDVAVNNDSLKDITKSVLGTKATLDVFLDDSDVQKRLREVAGSIDKTAKNVHASIKVVPEADVNKINALREKIQKAVSGARPTVNADIDQRDFINEVKFIKDEAKRILSKGISVDVDIRTSMMEELEALADLASENLGGSKPVEVKVRPAADDAEFARLRDQFNAYFRGVKTNIDVELDGENLQKQAYKLAETLKRMGKAGIPVDIERSDKFYEELNNIVYDIKGIDSFIKTRIEFEKNSDAEAKKALKDLEASSVIKVKPTIADAEARALKDRMSAAFGNIKQKIDVEIDGKEVRARAYELATEIGNMTRAGIPVDVEKSSSFHSKLESLVKEIESIDSTVSTRVENSKAAAAAFEAEMTALTRDRRVNISPNIKNFAKTVSTGMAEALTGIVPPREIMGVLEGVLGNFSQLSGKIALISTVAGSASSGIMVLSGSLGVMVSELQALPALLAVAPAGITALGLSATSTVMAFKGFKDALDGNADALAQLPVDAQAAVQALALVRDNISNGVQEAFWDRAGNSLALLATTTLPVFNDALKQSGRIAGSVFNDMASAVQRFSEAGSLDEFLARSNQGLQNMSRNMGPLADSLLRTANTGAKHFANFGNVVDDVVVRFSKFLDQANKSGDMDKWIKQASQSVIDLGSSLGSTVGIMTALGSAASEAGIGGFGTLAKNLNTVESALKSVRGQGALTDIFAGSASAIDSMANGLGKVFSSLAGVSPKLREILSTAGEIAGITFSNFADLIGKSSALDGLQALLNGARSAMNDLNPAFVSFGNILGDLGRIGGAVIAAVAPGLATLLSTVELVTGSLADGVTSAIPLINTLVTSMAALASSPIVVLAKAFEMLPGPIQTAAVMVGTLALSFVKLQGAIGTINAIRTAFSVFGSTLVASRADAAGWGTSMTTAFTAAKTSATGVASTATTAAGALTVVGASAKKSGTLLSTVGDGVSSVAKQLTSLEGAASVGSRALGGLKTAGTGLLGVLGGPLGLAVMGVTAAVGVAIHKNEEYKASIEGISSATDTYGQASQEVVKASEDMLGGTKGWLDALLKVDPIARSTSEGFEKLGWNTKDLAKSTVEANGAWTDQRGQLEELYKTTSRLGSVTEEQSMKILGTRDAVDLTRSELRAMADSLDEVSNASKVAADKHAEYTAELSDSMNYANNFKSAVDTMGSATSSVSEKMSALQTIMDNARGGIMSSADAAASYQTTMQGVSQSLADSGGSLAGFSGALVDANGQLDFTVQGTANLHETLKQGASAIQEVGVAAYDTALKNGASVEEAGRAATSAMQAPFAEFKAQLESSGLFTAEQIDAIVASYGAVPDEITTFIKAEDEASEKVLTTQRLMADYSNQNYDAMLGGVNDQALEAVASAMGMGREFADGEYDAIMTALMDEKGPDAAIKLLTEITGKDYQTAVDILADTGLLTETKRELDAVDGKTANGFVKIEDQEAYNKLNNFIGSLDNLDGKRVEAVANLVGDSREKTEEVVGKLDGIAGKNWDLRLNAEDNASAIVEAAHLNGTEFENSDFITSLDADSAIALMAIGDTMDKGHIFAGAEFKAKLGTMGIEATDADIQNIYDKMESVFGKDWVTKVTSGDISQVQVAAAFANAELDSMETEKNVDLGVTDGISPVLPTVKSGLGEIPESKDTDLNAKDNITGTLGIITQNLSTVPGSKSTDLNAIDNASMPVGAVAGAINGLPSSKTADLNAIDNGSAKVSTLQGVINGLNGKTVEATATPYGQPEVIALNGAVYSLTGKAVEARADSYGQPGVESMTGSINTLSGKTVAATTNSYGESGVQSMTGSIDRLPNKTVAATTNSYGESGVQSMTGSIDRLPNKTVSATANTYGKGDVDSLWSSIGALADKTVNIVTNFFNRQHNSEGGINDGAGVRTYANGGINKKAVARVNSYASGGFESHTAQIAKATPAYRVWAEPETQGEAYIPLAERKRARSVNILRQVAEMFGFELVKSSARIGSKLATQSNSTFLNGGLSGVEVSQRGNTTTVERDIRQNGSGSGIIINNTINPSTGMSEQRVAQKVNDQLTLSLIAGNI